MEPERHQGFDKKNKNNASRNTGDAGKQNVPETHVLFSDARNAEIALLVLRYQSHQRICLKLPEEASRPTPMRRTAWIWLAGCVVWFGDAVVSMVLHAPQHAELALLVSLLFGIAWLFYRGQKR